MPFIKKVNLFAGAVHCRPRLVLSFLIFFKYVGYLGIVLSRAYLPFRKQLIALSTIFTT